jgi:hypothetical protein
MASSKGKKFSNFFSVLTCFRPAKIKVGDFPEIDPFASDDDSVDEI